MRLLPAMSTVSNRKPPRRLDGCTDTGSKEVEKKDHGFHLRLTLHIENF